jgi:hypothetical protein
LCIDYLKHLNPAHWQIVGEEVGANCWGAVAGAAVDADAIMGSKALILMIRGIGA